MDPPLPSSAPDAWRLGLLDRALGRTGAGYVFQDAAGTMVACGHVPGAIGPQLRENADERTIFGERDGGRLRTTRETVFRDRSSQTIEIECAARASIYRFELEYVVFGERAGVLSVITDVSEQRHRERILKTLLREVSHRSKNLLAIIQGIATQTARQARSLDNFLVAFRGRIQSLSNSQDLVTDSSWRGAYFFELVARQTSAYWPASAPPMVPTGLNAHLSPNAALHVGLALHELIVNSASHGTIAAGADAISLYCGDTVFENAPAIEIVWIEHLAPARAPVGEGEPSFGRTVLERVVPAAVAGKALYLFSPERVEYHLTLPAREYEILRGTGEA
ncbi:sensor histidine kinase [Ensifer soli]|uniref:sensor histidine kinase n=1 Tax=Ciceribacter sp. sgz301302 TaxID=3342379 RepID=UPI0035BAD4C3